MLTKKIPAKKTIYGHLSHWVMKRPYFLGDITVQRPQRPANANAMFEIVLPKFKIPRHVLLSANK